jgi:hypothetical protein
MRLANLDAQVADILGALTEDLDVCAASPPSIN